MSQRTPSATQTPLLKLTVDGAHAPILPFHTRKRVTTCSSCTNRASCAPLWADLSLPLCPLNHPSPFPASWPSLLATAQSTMRRRAPSAAAGAAPGATLVRACCRRIGDSRARREAMCCILWMGCIPRMCLWRQGCPPSLPWAGLQIPYSHLVSSGASGGSRGGCLRLLPRRHCWLSCSPDQLPWVASDLLAEVQVIWSSKSHPGLIHRSPWSLDSLTSMPSSCCMAATTAEPLVLRWAREPGRSPGRGLGPARPPCAHSAVSKSAPRVQLLRVVTQLLRVVTRNW